jgi:hypothetical protein
LRSIRSYYALPDPILFSKSLYQVCSKISYISILSKFFDADQFYQDIEKRRSATYIAKGNISWVHDEINNSQKYRLGSLVRSDPLFIGQWGENKIDCVVRRCLITPKQNEKYIQRELAALTSRGNIHPNFIRYFGEEEGGPDFWYVIDHQHIQFSCIYIVNWII